MKKYRDNGAIGALLDEYERSIDDLKDVLANISHNEFKLIADPDATDANCRSVQTVLTHVVHMGYWYIDEIKKFQGEPIDYPKAKPLETIFDYQNALIDMFKYNTKFFKKNADIALTEKDEDKKIKMKWKQTYSVEQLIEHAIVHILRHRRQIERLLLNAKSKMAESSAD